jgi:hypothetical protein
VLTGHPRLSETVIAGELLRVERAGVPLRLFVIKPVEEHERGVRNPVVDAIATRPEYLPDPSGLTQPMHDSARAACAASGRPRCAPRAFLRRRRRAVVVGARPALALTPPRKIHVKELLQALAGRSAARRARGLRPARALRPRDHDRRLARRADRRPPVLLHRPRA